MSSIFDQLRKAAHAYYETAEPVMTDEEYDLLVEQARAADPTNAFFTQVGAVPVVGRVPLPCAMPSLKKIKPESIGSWKYVKQGPHVLSDKLDGISALWVCGFNQKPALYLRGNGLVGQDCTHLSKHIQGLKVLGIPSAMIRGELILPRKVAKEVGGSSRNWVNGVLHRSDPSIEDLGKVQFLAYQVLEPRSLTRSQQMTWLQNQGFLSAWHTVVPSVSVEFLSEIYKKRREESDYDCDGIVVGVDAVPTVMKDASEPSDAVAFKMAFDEQRATTTVVAVEWNSSRTKCWIPRVQFQPVKIGTVVIEWATGIHLQNIVEKGIGVGASIIVRRSGDVIPLIDSVLACVEPSYPPEGRWEWDATHTHAKDTSTEETNERKALCIHHTLVTIGIERLGKTMVLKLVESGLQNIQDIFKAPMKTLQDSIGKKNGETLFQNCRGLGGVSKLAWITSYPYWPPGFGSTRIESALETESDISKWPSLKVAPKGQTMTTFTKAQAAVPGFVTWFADIQKILDLSTISVSASVSASAPTTLEKKVTKGTYVMSGFRDKDVSALLEGAGWEAQERVTKSTTVLLVPDDAKETGKVRDARAAGVRIITRSEIKTLL